MKVWNSVISLFRQNQKQWWKKVFHSIWGIYYWNICSSQGLTRYNRRSLPFRSHLEIKSAYSQNSTPFCACCSKITAFRNSFQFHSIKPYRPTIHTKQFTLTRNHVELSKNPRFRAPNPARQSAIDCYQVHKRHPCLQIEIPDTCWSRKYCRATRLSAG